MSIPLTLRPPTPRNERPLTAGLLLAGLPPSVPTVSVDPAVARMLGPARVPASAARADQSGLFVDLDIDPEQLSAVTAPIRYFLDCAAADVPEAIALRTPVPLVLFIEPDATHGLAEAALLAVDAGQSVGLVAGRSGDEIADFLAVLTHSMVGFVLRAADADEVVCLVAATVASMRGDDVRAALAQPSLQGLIDLNDEAATTVREILLGIEVADPASVAQELVQRGLGQLPS